MENIISPLKKRFFLFLITAAFVSGGIYYYYQQELNWSKFYQTRLGKEPRILVQKAIQLLKEKNISPGIAYDLGIGVGNETALLLKEGWHVVAVEARRQAIEVFKNRKDITDWNNVQLVHSKFQKVDWKRYPRADLVIASYTFPFVSEKHFPQVWKQTIRELEPGGWFVGHFFGKKYRGFSKRERQKMSFHSKREVIQLFKNFDILYFNEVDRPTISSTGNQIHKHSYEVIARKRTD